MAMRLKCGDVVKIRRPKSMGPITPGSIDAAFESRVGLVVASEGDRPKMYRVRFVPAVQVPGVGPVTDDLWCREYLQKQRD